VKSRLRHSSSTKGSPGRKKLCPDPDR